jgi:hypothetical protein
MCIGGRKRLRPAVPKSDARAAFGRKWRGAAATHGYYSGFFGVFLHAPFEVPLARDLRELAQPPERVADIEQQPEAICADGLVLCHHQHVLEEPV